MGVIQEFKKFVLRGSLVDMAIGFTVGAAFSTVARSLVDNILMPPIGFLIGDTDFADLFIVLRAGTEQAPPYATLAEAQAAGAVTLNYGLFVNSLVALLVVAVAIFIVIRLVNSLEERLEARFGEEKPPEEPSDKKCPYCRMTIPYRASKCGHCTADLPDSVAPAGG